MNIQYTKEIRQFCKTLIRSDGMINVAILKTKQFKESKYIVQIQKETKWIDKYSIYDLSISSRIKLINENITTLPKCKNPDCINFVTVSSSGKFKSFCSKSCACSVHNKTSRKETLIKKSKEFYNSSEIMPLQLLKEEIQTLRNKYRDVNEYRLTRAGLGKAIDYYVKDNIDMYRKANMIMKDILELPNCKNPNCSNKVKDIKHEFCSSKCQVQYNLPKMQNTCLEKYGFANPYQVPVIKEKIKNIFIDKYGVSNPNKYKEVREKIELTCLEKYGVRNWVQLGLQPPSNTFKWKDYIYPSGKIIQIQGYEWKLLDELLCQVIMRVALKQIE